MSSSFRHELIIAVYCSILDTIHVQCGKKISYPILYCWRFHDLSLWLPAHNVHGCHVTPITRGFIGYVPYQKGATQGLSDHREALGLCSWIVLALYFSFSRSFQAVFPYNMSVKYTMRDYFPYVFLVHVTHWLLYQTDEINTIFQPCAG